MHRLEEAVGAPVVEFLVYQSIHLTSWCIIFLHQLPLLLSSCGSVSLFVYRIVSGRLRLICCTSLRLSVEVLRLSRGVQRLFFSGRPHGRVPASVL